MTAVRKLTVVDTIEVAADNTAAETAVTEVTVTDTIEVDAGEPAAESSVAEEHVVAQVKEEAGMNRVSLYATVHPAGLCVVSGAWIQFQWDHLLIVLTICYSRV